MESRSRKITIRYSAIAAVAAFVTQPIPALDELIVVPIQYDFVRSMAKARGVPLRKLPWGPLQKIIWYGAVARLAGNFSLGLVPVVGMFSNAVTAIALTEYLAWYLDKVMTNPDQPPPDVSLDQLKKLFATAGKKREKKAKKSASEASSASSAGA